VQLIADPMLSLLPLAAAGAIKALAVTGTKYEQIIRDANIRPE
jgi:hypothetical protein